MDPAKIATGVLAILVPYLVKGAKEFVNLAGQAAYEKAKGMLDKLKARWTGDSEAAPVLQQFEQKPERYGAIVKDILQEKLAQDPNLARELANLLKEIDAPTLQIVQKMNEAKDVIGVNADELNKGEVSVTQEMGKAEGVTGAKIGRIG